ncbi:hypothetical protein [Oceanobacillus salinisoli]|uniref:hypothetical protein n=1 Tax=Oceanobacillus salinisoli TaxID=2678611 RepID=UPI0012E12657|nr:hypothetical protein [Oceanobacillus salinisoli]
MNTTITFVVIFVFFYTAGFAVTLWREKNKLGSAAVFLLAVSIVITPFFSVFR